ncbi:MAG: type II 3-dehydroquinate dehydratase, partial [Myxococcaceae bacterium]
MKILVVHGPNLNLLGEREGDEKGKTLEGLNGLIRSTAAGLGLEVKILQSNHEGAIVDALHAERRWADGVIINPAALTHTSYVLREALFGIGKPALEVHLTDIRRRESWRRKSVIKEVCAAQVMGKGFDSYVIALQRFASGDLAGRKKGSKAKAPPAPAKPPARAKAEVLAMPVAKTLGAAPRAAAAPAPVKESARKTMGPAPSRNRS